MNEPEQIPDELPEPPENALVMRIKVTPIDEREDIDIEENKQ